ncbi:MAG TPA: CDGSH iron-sulfur domain-containing protein [Dehalococcoidia bacterium]|nr:CDGSH iron-sulfur domain-containing protein [Dehalococcoidia bacterium]
MAEPATITAYNNGPYVVSGDARIVDQDGNEIETQGASIALCRCGQSGKKPFCDGTHAKVGFQSVLQGGSP